MPSKALVLEFDFIEEFKQNIKYFLCKFVILFFHKFRRTNDLPRFLKILVSKCIYIFLTHSNCCKVDIKKAWFGNP